MAAPGEHKQRANAAMPMQMQDDDGLAEGPRRRRKPRAAEPQHWRLEGDANDYYQGAAGPRRTRYAYLPKGPNYVFVNQFGNGLKRLRRKPRCSICRKTGHNRRKHF
jgi:hypothetical protein